jgi:HK97 family phage prohead protease
MPAIAYRKTDTSDGPWDAGENIKRIPNTCTEEELRQEYAWVDPEGNPDAKSSYKFPHHEVSDSGDVGAANIKACQSAIGILNGSMGGSSLSDTDKQGVYDHSSKHLRDAGVTPPDLERSRQLKGERRSFSMPDITAEPEGNVIQGHAAVFGQRTNIYDCFYEVIERGAFDRTDFTDVLFSINHDLDEIPLARSRNNNANSTLQLQVDDQGLNTKAILDIDNNTQAKALYGSIGRGDINGMSFIFQVRGEEWEGEDTAMPTRHITGIAKVYEVSAVSMPFYDGTDISARNQGTLESALKALESARSKLESSEIEQEKRNQEQRDKETRDKQQTQELELLRLRAEILAKGSI